MFKEKNYGVSSLKGILAAYLVLVLHVVLIAVIGVLVLFFKGIVNYAMVIFLVILLLISASVLYVYRKIRKKIKELGKLDRKYEPGDHPLEINFLGGLASFRLRSPVLKLNDDVLLNAELPQLGSYEHSKRQKIVELANLLEKELITIDEYNKAKRDIFHS